MDVTMWMLVCSVSTAVLLVLVTAVCPYNVEACTCTGASLVCRNLDGIPALASDNKDGLITDLTFTSGKLNNITDSSLPANLHSLTFSNVNISSLSSDAFSSSADTLQSLSMSSFNLSELPDALLNVNNLTELTLIDVAITNWTLDILQHLEQTLRSVVFENVGLTSWPEWLKDFTLLNSADLSRNKMYRIPADAFSKLRYLTNLSLASTRLGDRSETNAALRSLNGTLQILNISDNFFTVIPQAIAGMSKLSKLDISFNLIKEVTSDRIPSQVTELDLSRNVPLRGLNDSSFPNTSSLEVLILSGTGIISISNLTFQPLKHLRVLYLADTSLSEIPLALTKLNSPGISNISDNDFSVIPQALAVMSKLSKLDISSNLIKEVTSDRIPPQITELDLSRNYELKELRDNSFPNTSFLEVLILSWTRIISISNLTFQPLKHLRVLYLDYTRLTEIPLALTKLNNLEMLKMDVILFLNCTCPRDVQLVKWFQSQKSLELSGNCSYKLTIHNYLTNTPDESPCFGCSLLTSNLFLYLFLAWQCVFYC